jgi:hypothetical protein
MVVEMLLVARYLYQDYPDTWDLWFCQNDRPCQCDQSRLNIPFLQVRSKGPYMCSKPLRVRTGSIRALGMQENLLTGRAVVYICVHTDERAQLDQAGWHPI